MSCAAERGNFPPWRDEGRASQTDGDRVATWLKAAGEQALRNSNMGQIDAYRINHMISLIEQIRWEERERCARIADEYSKEVLPVDPGGIARIVAGRIRSGQL
jgi:hypothetical protein